MINYTNCNSPFHVNVAVPLMIDDVTAGYILPPFWGTFTLVSMEHRAGLNSH